MGREDSLASTGNVATVGHFPEGSKGKADTQKPVELDKSNTNYSMRQMDTKEEEI